MEFNKKFLNGMRFSDGTQKSIVVDTIERIMRGEEVKSDDKHVSEKISILLTNIFHNKHGEFYKDLRLRLRTYASKGRVRCISKKHIIDGYMNTSNFPKLLTDQKSVEETLSNLHIRQKRPIAKVFKKYQNIEGPNPSILRPLVGLSSN